MCACSPQAEAIAPQLLETLQDPGGTGAGPTRLRLLDALAKVAGLGVGTAYREVVVLLGRLYLNHVQVRPPGGLEFELIGRLEEGVAMKYRTGSCCQVSGHTGLQNLRSEVLRPTLPCMYCETPL